MKLRETKKKIEFAAIGQTSVNPSKQQLMLRPSSSTTTEFPLILDVAVWFVPTAIATLKADATNWLTPIRKSEGKVSPRGRVAQRGGVRRIVESFCQNFYIMLPGTMSVVNPQRIREKK